MESNGFPAEWDEFLRTLTGSEPEDIRNYLSQVQQGLAFAFGSTVPKLGAETRRHGEFEVPAHANVASPLDTVGVYVTLAEYLPEVRENFESDDEFLAYFASAYPADSMILGLVLLNRIATNEDELQRLTDEFVEELAPGPSERLRTFLEAEPERRRLLARQQVLAGLKLLLTREPDSEGRLPEKSTPVISAIILAHAIGSFLAADRATEETLAGYPAYFVMEITRLSLMYASDDEFASIDRIVRLWRDYGDKITKYPLREHPLTLLQEATGLELEVILGLGFLLYAQTVQWNPHKPPFMNHDYGSNLPDDTKRAFTKLVADTSKNLATKLKGHESPFDFLPFQETPVMDTPTGLLVIDAAYLWDRFTSGLFYFVHDYEKGLSEANRQSWNQAFSEMVEMMVEDQLRAMAIPDLAGGTTFYMEEDFARAYGGKQCDVGLTFGDRFLLVEIVSGRLSVPTRIEGDLEKFGEDTDRLVINKCRQLHEAAQNVLRHEAALTGHESAQPPRIVPAVVVAGGYPLNPMTTAYIKERLKDEALLDDPRIDPIAIIDLGELEILEGISEAGKTPAELLADWQSSALAETSFKNYVIRVFGSTVPYRPSRMKEKVFASFREVLDAIQLKAEDNSSTEGDSSL